MNGEESLDARLARMAALAEPVRRMLYRHVASQTEPVSRDGAAEALGVPHHVAKFHLDRLVADGFLEAEYRRPPGRGGPGAGRPTKLYRRSARELAVSLPERRYDLAGRLLAEAVSETERSGTPVAETLANAGRAAGRSLGEEARRRAGPRSGRAALLGAARQVLDEQGYETRVDPSGITLVNCPFDVLARDYTELVCGMNLDLMDGLLAGLNVPGLAARLDPAPGRCCVRIGGRMR